MTSLQNHFIILQYSGVWRPLHWPIGWKRKFYDTYTCLIMFIVVSLVISECVEFVRLLDDIKAFADNSLILLTMVGVCGKAINILMKREEIFKLARALQRDPFRPKSEDELSIQRKFDEIVRSNTLRYATLVTVAYMAEMWRSAVDDIPQRVLLHNSWVPAGCHQSLLCYSIAYSHQVVAITVGAAIHVAFDTLITGLIMQICAQLHILKHRFSEMPILTLDKLNFGIRCVESTTVAQNVRHHIEIFKFARTLNDIFGIMICIQYMYSTLVICVSVFELSNATLFSAEFTFTVLYSAAMLIQIFMFCFYGGEGTLESTALGDAIYEMNWTTLDVKMKRNLLTIMLRTLRPIEFSSFYITTLNLVSFNSLIKLSYSVYNLLQQKR